MQQDVPIAIAADHAGFAMKDHIKTYLEKKGIPVQDLSAPQLDPADDYPEFGFKLARAVAQKTFTRGILFCGTGIGISIAANRVRGVRAALCTSPELARMSREHNDANVLVIGGRTTPQDTAEKIVDAWLSGVFAGDRHGKRVAQLDQ